MKTLSSPVELIKKSLEIFSKRENIIFLLKIYLPLLPAALFRFAIGSFSKLQPGTSTSSLFSLYPWLITAAWVTLIIGLLYIVIGFWVSVSGILGVQRILENSKLSVRDTYIDAWKKLARFAVLVFATGFLVILGFLLLIVPGIILSVWFSFAGYELVTKNTGIKESLIASKRLVSGRFWKVFGRIFVFGLFGLLAQVIISIIPFGIGYVIWPLLGGLFILPYYLLYVELSER